MSDLLLRPTADWDTDPATPTVSPGTSWAARYGQLILTDGIAPLPTALLYYQGALELGAAEVWLVMAVLAQRGGRGLPRPNLRQLQAESGVGLRNLQHLRARLEARGFLVSRPQYDGQGRQVGNSYDFAGLLAALEAVVGRDPALDNGIAEPGAGADPVAEDGSVVARYGRLIARVGIAAIPRAVFRYQAALQLSPQQVWLISYILAHRWTTAVPYPSLSRMAERTGYSRRQLQVLKDELVTAGRLVLTRRYAGGGGQASNGYDFSPLFAQLETLVQQPPALALLPAAVVPPVSASPSQPRRGRRGAGGEAGRMIQTAQGGAQVSGIGGMSAHSQGRMIQTAQGGTQPDSQGGVQSRSGDDPDCTGGDDPQFTGEGAARFTGEDDPQFTRKESNQEDQIKRDDSNQIPDSEGSAADSTAHRYSPYIAGVILDHSRELGDRQGPSNVTQAHRLWAASGLTEDAFVALLHTARDRTRRYQGKQGSGTISNKMGYYFRVVANRDPAGGAPGEDR